MICARCLLPNEKPLRRLQLLTGTYRIFQTLAGVVILWLFFFLVGGALIKLPVRFHDGTVWSSAEAGR
jgi:hypothetical protein